MRENAALDRGFDFAVRIVNLYKYMTKEKKEYILSKQLMRSGTSIGANISEAQMGQSKADFIAKMSIALKEAYESQYWIKLLYKTDYLKKSEYDSLNSEIDILIKLLVSICKSARDNT